MQLPHQPIGIDDVIKMRHITPIGELLRNHRTAKGFTIGSVCTYLGISEKYISEVELGKRPPPKYDVLLGIGIYLGIKPEELMWSAARYYHDNPVVNKAKTRNI